MGSGRSRVFAGVWPTITNQLVKEFPVTDRDTLRGTLTNDFQHNCVWVLTILTSLQPCSHQGAASLLSFLGDRLGGTRARPLLVTNRPNLLLTMCHELRRRRKSPSAVPTGYKHTVDSYFLTSKHITSPGNAAQSEGVQS